MPDLTHAPQLLRLTVVAAVGIVVAVFLQWAIARQLRRRKRADALLRASQNQLSGILAIAADAILLIDESHNIIQFNRGAEEIFGYPAAEIIGKPLELLLPDSAVGAHRSHVAAFARSGETARRMGARREVSGKRRNGMVFPAEASISKLDTPAGMRFCVVLRDATEQKRREQHEHLLSVSGAQLAASLEYEETLRVAAAVAVPTLGDWCVLDVIEEGVGERRTIRRVTSRHPEPARETVLLAMEERGLDWDSPSAVIDVLRTGKPLLLPSVDEDWLEAHSDNAAELTDINVLGVRSLLIVPLSGREAVFGALTIVRGLGRLPMDDDDLELARAIGLRVGLAIDNAVHFRAEHRATMARDEIMAIVSHDLRNPVNAIRMCVHSLTRNPPTNPEEQALLLGTIGESAEWMRRMIQDLVDVATIEAGKLQVEPAPQEVEPIILATVEMFAARAREGSKALRGDLPDGLPQIAADRSRIMQVLANLVDNALKFTHDGGQVTLSAVVQEEMVVFTVADTGAGIPAEHLPYLFDRFWYARGKSLTHGSGLGLAIARGIVTAHAGRIWVETAEGKGSAFRFTLPIANGGIPA